MRFLFDKKGERRFFVCWDQDYGWAVNSPIIILRGLSVSDIKANWVERVRAAGYQCNPAYGNRSVEITPVPSRWGGLSDDQAIKVHLKEYNETRALEEAREANAKCDCGRKAIGNVSTFRPLLTQILGRAVYTDKRYFCEEHQP